MARVRPPPMSEFAGIRPNRANLSIGTNGLKQSGPATTSIAVGDTMILSLIAAWILIGFIACLTGTGN